MSVQTKKIVGMHIIGLDEFHNGFHFNHLSSTNLPFGVFGSLCMRHTHSQHSAGRYESKGGVFSERMSVDELQKRATYYIDTHPNFFYLTILESSYKRGDSSYLRAGANAIISLKFFDRFSELNQDNTVVVLDKINGSEESDFITRLTREYLSKAGFPRLSVFWKEHADKSIPAVRSADMLGYYIFGLRYRSPNRRWPCRLKKLNLQDYLTLSGKVIERE